MTIFSLFGLSFLATLIFMVVVWLISLPLKNASIVDIFWGLGFVLASLVYFFFADGFGPRKALIVALVAVWGTRLSLHIFLRNRNKGEDPRYAAWRRDYGPERYWWISFFQVFMLQGAILWIVAVPLMTAMVAPGGWTLWDGLGAMVWGVGFLFEAVGDWQLARFKANPANKGRVMNQGLWAYTRHPNYFGDALVWWGFYLITLSAGGWWTIFSPILMTTLLIRVSGVAMLEKSMETRPGYREYIASTPAFFPKPPKRP